MDPGALERRLRADVVADGYLRPRYADYSFANVLGAAAAKLGVDLGRAVPPDAVSDVDGIERVVVLVVDGFGWHQWTRDATDHPHLGRLASTGLVVPLTSLYPTETAACMTTFHTGQPPARHGLIGWDVYVEEWETVVQPLPFCTVDGQPLDPVVDGTPTIERLVGAEPVYPGLRADGVEPTVVHPADTAGSPYSEWLHEGANVVGYEGVPELGTAIRQALEAGPTPQYLHGYYPAVDAAAHHDGTGSSAHRRALADLDAAIEALLDGLDPAVAAETLLFLTADHGAVDTDPTTNVDLYGLDGVRSRLRRRSDGTPVPPVGGPRNVHLHVRPGTQAELKRRLDSTLDALVLDRPTVLEVGLFGDAAPADRVRRRTGDLVVIPRERSVWYGADAPGLAYVGMHGGLHPDEAIVPFASVRLADL